MTPKPFTVSPILTTQFQARAAGLGFNASCETLTAQLHGTLAANKPSGQVLELGTGVGLGSAQLAEVVRIWTGQAG